MSRKRLRARTEAWKRWLVRQGEAEAAAAHDPRFERDLAARLRENDFFHTYMWKRHAGELGPVYLGELLKAAEATSPVPYAPWEQDWMSKAHELAEMWRADEEETDEGTAAVGRRHEG